MSAKAGRSPPCQIMRAFWAVDVTLPMKQAKGGFPFIVIVAAICLAIAYVVLRYTRFGRYVYMTGASKPAARLAGVNTNMILVAVLTISGFTAGMAGIVSMGRLGSAQPDPVPSYLLDTIARWCWVVQL